MNTKSKATVATIGLGALVLSGGTLALWQDNADLHNTTINTGHLSIDYVATSYYDISDLKLQEDVYDAQPGHQLAEPVDGGPRFLSPEGDGSKSMADLPDHEIDLGMFTATPGDTILVVQEIEPQLKGHNLLARLDIIDEAGMPLTTGITYTYTDGSHGPVAGSDLVDAFSISEPVLYSQLIDPDTGALAPVALDAANGGPTGDPAWVFTTNDTMKSLWVAYEITFSENDGPVGGVTDGDASEMDGSVDIQKLGVQLTQVREAATP